MYDQPLLLRVQLLAIVTIQGNNFFFGGGGGVKINAKSESKLHDSPVILPY